MLKAYITDVDGTLTDQRRRVSTEVIEEMRRLIDSGIPIVLSSGNTVCFLDTFAHMIGTEGSVIAENGGAYRHTFLGKLQKAGDHDLCIRAYQKVIDELQPKGNDLRLFSGELRYSDVSFSRDAPVDVVKEILKDVPVEVIDTGFAIHLMTPGLSKGRAFEKLADLMGLKPSEFLVTGDSGNDVSMLKLGGAAVVPANGSAEAKAAAGEVLEKPYGDGVAEALRKYFP